MPIQVTGAQPVPPALGANYFHFTVVGAEVQMLIGSLNLLRVHEAMQGETQRVTPDITHRFLLSPLGFAHLKRQIDEIAVLMPPSFEIGKKGTANDG